KTELTERMKKMSDLQKHIIRDMHVLPEIDPKKEIRRSVDFLKDYLRRYPFLKTMVLGISGGQDSTLAGKLCQMAAEELRTETNDDAYRFIALRLPYGRQSDEEDAKKAIEWIQPDETLRIDIKPSVDACIHSVLDSGIQLSDFNEGNVK